MQRSQTLDEAILKHVFIIFNKKRICYVKIRSNVKCICNSFITYRYRIVEGSSSGKIGRGEWGMTARVGKTATSLVA